MSDNTENPWLMMPVDVTDSPLKTYLVEYAGTKLDTEEVTVHMIAEVMAAEFPELMFSLAEENYIKGYQTGLDDAANLHYTTTQEETETTN